MTKITRALLSVSDKTALVPFARALAARGIELLSTGGTAALLAAEGVPVTEVGAYTGYPELMDGRLKTLHPKVHGGILARRGIDEAAMAAHEIGPIDLVVVNLYPFEQTVARPDCDLDTAIENIDIGGPTMVRAAAKNHAHVAVVVDPADYPRVQAAVEQDGGIAPALRFQLAAKAFTHTARYDAAIAAYLNDRRHPEPVLFPPELGLHFHKALDLRYGENPHQRAAFYVQQPPPPGSIAAAELVQGKALSFNNIADADAALACVRAFPEGTACVIVKHANPCGVGLGPDVRQAYERAYATDPSSAFGGIIAFNRPVDVDTAAFILDRQFVEVIVAPGLDPAARAALSRKANVRVLVYGTAAPAPEWDYKRVSGGLLVQEGDGATAADAEFKVVSRRPPDEREWRDLRFAWAVTKFVKSNAIVLCRDQRTIGIGAGQMSRVDSSRMALMKAGDAALPIAGAAMGSDAFFPFRDGIDIAAAAGVSAVVHPGGSMRDAEVIAAADEHGMAMVLTGVRHFRH